MGDRANIAVIDSGERVYLYTHWKGADLPSILHNAMNEGRDRWDDPAYLTRVIFCSMMGDDKGVSGYGISPHIGDNEYPVIVVDCDKEQIYLEPTEIFEIRGENPLFSFERFAAEKAVTWRTLDTGRT